MTIVSLKHYKMSQHNINNKENHMPAAFQIKGSLFTLSVLQLLNTDLKEIEQQLTNKIKQAPQFFNHAPIVIDLNLLEKSVDITFINDLNLMLKKHTLIPVGYHTKDKVLSKALSQALFPIFKDSRNIPSTQSEAPEKAQNKLIETRIRSGQQVVAQNGDLIVLSSVSPGAELLASGNIHVYGTLRGRAIAGLNGDTNARIFCHKLEADLISIAGQYRIFEEDYEHENGDNLGYQIQLKDGTIVITSL